MARPTLRTLFTPLCMIGLLSAASAALGAPASPLFVPEVSGRGVVTAREAVAPRPAETTSPTFDRLAYEGLYDLTYTQLRGELRICSGVRVYEICAPVTIDAPLTDGQVTEESLEFILVELEKALAAAFGTVPDPVLYAIEDALVTYLFPELVVAMNENVADLPVLMDLEQNPLSPSYFTSSFTCGDGTLIYGIGEVQLETGVFKLIPDYVQGQMDPASGYNGMGVADFPVRIQESIEVSAPWGTEEVWLTATGTLGADFDLTRR